MSSRAAPTAGVRERSATEGFAGGSHGTAGDAVLR